MHRKQTVFSWSLWFFSFIDTIYGIMHLDTHWRGAFYCDMCGSSFSRKSDLVNRMESQYGKKPYSWEVCGSSFFTGNYCCVNHSSFAWNSVSSTKWNHILVKSMDPHFQTVCVLETNVQTEWTETIFLWRV